jgi:hypothetical protein
MACRGRGSCYFLDPDDQVRSAETFDAEADADAIARALATLKMRPHHHAIELWQAAADCIQGRGNAELSGRG